VKLRRLAFVVVNAEKTTMGDWAMDQKGPDGIETAGALVDVTINAPKRQAYDAFRSMLQDWRRDLVTYRCGLSAADAAVLGAGAGWACDDVEIRLDMISFADLPGDLPTKLGSADTTVSLPKDLVDALIAGGRTAIETNPLARSLMSEPVR
jgi:NTE family protein